MNVCVVWNCTWWDPAMRGEARVATRGWGSSDSTRAFRAGPTAAASARLLTWYAAPSSFAALKSCKTQHSNRFAMTLSSDVVYTVQL